MEKCAFIQIRVLLVSPSAVFSKFLEKVASNLRLRFWGGMFIPNSLKRMVVLAGIVCLVVCPA